MAIAVEFVLVLVMALLSLLRIITSSLPAQGGQRRPSLFNILRDIPNAVTRMALTTVFIIDVITLRTLVF